MLKQLTCAAAGICALFALVSADAALPPVPLYLDVPVSDVGTDNTLQTPNTSRKLAVGADGTIYALFRSPTNGIRVARSTNRGQSFSASVQVSATNAEAELAISNDGDLHVAWVTGGNIFHVISQDGAATFSTPLTVGAGASSAHMALDGDRVYIVPRNGSRIYRSDDDGATFAATLTGATYAFADIFVDPLTHDVVLAVDSPAVSFYRSSDFAQTLVGPTATGKSITYSVGALASTDTGRYLFMAGSGTNLERIEFDTPAYVTSTVAATSGSTTRSLSADIFGNVVSGYLEAGTNNLKFEHSNDFAATIGTATTVVTSASRANAAINTINGDILFLYEKANQIFLSTYERALVGYDITVSPSALNFSGVEVGATADLPVQLTNVTASPVAIGSLAASTDFVVNHDCGSSLAAGASCTATVTFAPSVLGAASGTLTMSLGGVTRRVPLNGTGIPPRQPTTTDLDASVNTAGVGDSVTLNAAVTGTAVTGTVDFTENGAAVTGCSAVALTGTTASCVVSSLTAGVKLYSASYSGDVYNAPSTSSVKTVAVGTFTVTPSAAAGGSLSPGTAQSVTYGNTVTLTATPASGYQLVSISGCSGARTGATYVTGPVTADCTVTATFSLLAQEVEVRAKSEGGAGAMAWPMLLFGMLAAFVRRGALISFASLLMFGRAYADETRWFVGGAIGQARGEQGASEVSASLTRQGFTADSVDIGDLDRTTYRLFGGYRLGPILQVQVGYRDIGEVETNASATVPAAQADAYARALLDALPVTASGYEASVGFQYPIAQAVTVGGRVGVWHWDNDQRATYGAQRLKKSTEGTDAILALAFEWNFTSRWAMGIEASRYRTDREDFDLLEASMKFLWR